MKKYKSVLLLYGLFLSLCFTGVANAEETFILQEEKTWVDADAEENHTNLLQGYIDTQLFEEEILAASVAGDSLEGINQDIYESLKTYIQQVAAGERTSTTFSLSMMDLGLADVSYTAEELGVSAIVENNKISSQAVTEATTRIGYERSKILSALLFDCPYDLYWYDKTKGVSSSGIFGASYDGTEWTLVVVDELKFEFTVAGEYAADTYAVDATKTGAVKTALNTITSIVNQYSASSDYEKLLAFKNEICTLVEYNHEAADNDDTPYGNPWQLIWVFDGDDSTKVVCEGYSKAFQYLFDLSDINPNITCISVTGTMSGGTGAGGHMWNIVSVNGENYLVDVTNCDEKTAGYPDKLFMAGYDNVDGDWYGFDCGSETIWYIYDDDLTDNFNASLLQISDTDYDPASVVYEGVAIDESHFPEEAFRQYVATNTDTDGNGYLSDDEIQNVTQMSFSNQSITSLKGIEYFTELKSLYCFNLGLTELDLTENVAIETLTCACNNLTSLSLPVNGALHTLDCTENSLAELDVTQCPALKYLTCSSNQLTQIDVGNNTELINLICNNNQIEMLDLSNNEKLCALSCSNNNLTSLDVSQNSDLDVLLCDGNQMTELQVSGNPLLETLHCDKNNLVELDVSNNELLTDLECQDNDLTNLNGLANTSLTRLVCSNNNLTDLDIYQNTDLTYLDCCNNSLEILDISNCPVLIEILKTGTALHEGYYYLDSDKALSFDEAVQVIDKNSYTVTFDANGGAVSIENKTVTNGETYGELPEATRAGYSFEGWFTAEEDGKAVTGETVVDLTADQTLYAHWIEEVEIVDSGTCGNNLTWALDREGTLTISGSGDMEAYPLWDGLNSPWYEQRDAIIKVVVSDCVTSIGDFAFFECNNLTDIEMANSVKTIGESSFGGCYSLEYISLPDGVETIGKSSFSSCANLSGITIPESVMIIGDGAFESCTNLVDITLPSSIDRIVDYLFYNCNNLNTISIPYGVTSIGAHSFEGCENLISITIPDSVTSIETAAFQRCTSLTGIEIPSSVTNIGYEVFEYCESLTSVIIPNSISNIGNGTFAYCTSLTEIIIPDGVTSIGDWVFEGCASLQNIFIPASVTSIGNGAFSKCESLLSIEVAADNPNYSSLDGVLYNKDISALLIYPGGKEDAYVIPSSIRNIEKYAFQETGLTSVTIPETFTKLDDYTFWGCKSLMSVTIPSSVKSIGHSAFGQCESLANITIPDSVTSIAGYAFYECSGLQNITLSNSITRIGELTFYGCSSLASINIPSSVTSIGNSAFRKCGNLVSVTLPESLMTIEAFSFEDCNNLSVITIPESVMSIGGYAFCSCSSLTSITIPPSVTRIEKGAFYGCRGLSSITISSSVTSIGIQAFEHCAGLTSVILPDSMTTIEERAFQSCTGLTSIIIPDGVVEIGGSAFMGCTSLTSILIPESATSIGKLALHHSSNGSFRPLTNITIYCVEGSQAQTYAEENDIPWLPMEAFYKYTVTYYSNGDVTVPEVQIKSGGEALVLSSEHPVQAGYVFYTWNTEADGSGTAYKPEEKYNIDADMDLYAQWISEDMILSLPAALTAVEEQAFQSVQAEAVRIPQGVNTIADDAFEVGTIIIAVPGSYAYEWAVRNRFDVISE